MFVRLIRPGNPTAPPAPLAPHLPGSPAHTVDTLVTWEMSATSGTLGFPVGVGEFRSFGRVVTPAGPAAEYIPPMACGIGRWLRRHEKCEAGRAFRSTPGPERTRRRFQP
ncbi:hypothetical protein GCM10010392_18320 [Streptomyces clavifer]|nr:hypothetical protein GCM10010392_18320 [Streptomyces clavifer]